MLVAIQGEEGRHLGRIIGIPWPGSKVGLGVHVAIIRSFFVVCAAIFLLSVDCCLYCLLSVVFVCFKNI